MGVLLIAASAFQALIQYRRAALESRVRYTFDVLNNFEMILPSELEVQKIVNEFIDPKEESKITKNEREAFYQYLNTLERLSLGVRKGILEEEIIREYLETYLIDAYNTTKPYINLQRENWDDLEHSVPYSDLEALARRWSERRQSNVS